MRNLPARRRLLLTGTPVQNHLDELWSLAEFCAPGRLAESQEAFRRRFVLTRCGSRNSDCDDTSDAAEAESSAAFQLSRLLSTFLLRRTVDVIQTELPRKSNFIHLLPLRVMKMCIFILHYTGVLLGLHHFLFLWLRHPLRVNCLPWGKIQSDPSRLTIVIPLPTLDYSGICPHYGHAIET